MKKLLVIRSDPLLASSLLVILSIYAVSFMLPVLEFMGESISGWFAFLAVMTPPSCDPSLSGLALVGAWFWWLANPLFVIALFCLATGRNRVGAFLGAIALLSAWSFGFDPKLLGVYLHGIIAFDHAFPGFYCWSLHFPQKALVRL